MENINKEQLKDILLNVRKAYRLLFEYQTKILNLVKYIGNYFGYSEATGNPKFSKDCPKKNSKIDFDDWAWDWLIMYDYDFHFSSKRINDYNITFSVRIISDTGYYDSNTKDKDELNPETFEPVETSKTKLVLIAGKKGWEKGYDKLFKNFSSKQNEYSINKEDIIMFAKSYDLEDFIDEDHTNEQLENFVQSCKRHGIIIK